MTFIRLAEIIQDKARKSHGFKRQADASYIVELAQTLLEGDPFPARGLKVVSFRRGVLKIIAAGSASAAELKMRENEFREHLNKELKNSVIKKLLIITG